MNIYILTDGVWEPNSDVAGAILSLARTLLESDYPPRQVAIQFIRFGHDPEGAEKLDHLASGHLGMYVTIGLLLTFRRGHLTY